MLYLNKLMDTETNMTPVAGRISDAEEDGFVFSFCFGKGFFTPGIPVDRIMCMLE